MGYNMEKKMWYVVQFAEEGTLGVVPNNWITADGKTTYWPPFKTDKKVQIASERRTIPCEETWDLYQLKGELNEATTYEIGVEKLLIRENHSDVDQMYEQTLDASTRHVRHEKLLTDESEASLPNNKQSSAEVTLTQNPIVQNKFLTLLDSFNNSDLEDSEEVIDEIQEKLDEPINKLNEIDDDSDENIEDVHLIQNSVQTNNPQDAQVHPATSTQGDGPAGQKVNGFSQNDDTVIGLLQEVILNQNKIQYKLEMTPMNNTNGEEEIMTQQEKFMSVLPLKTLDTFNAFECKLSQSEKMRRKTRSFLKTFGGRDAHHTTRNILAAVITNELATKFSFKGKKRKGVTKKSFNNTFIHKKVIEIVVLADYPNWTKNKIKKSTETWLKEAPKRLKDSVRPPNDA